MHPSLSRPRPTALLVLLAAVLLASCGRESPSGADLVPGETLFLRHAPQILVESPRLARPPEPGANRFLDGWWPWRHRGQVVLGGSPGGARLQLIHLQPRGRRLALDLVDDPERVPGTVHLEAAGRDLGSFAWSDPLVLRLPADLPLGAVTLELTPEAREEGAKPPPLDVVEARVSPAMGGAAWVEGVDLVQGPTSRVEVGFWARGGGALTGTFLPPAAAAPGQLFQLTLEAADGRQLGRFSWRAGERAGPRALRLSVPEGVASGPCRVIAEAVEEAGASAPGAERAGRWQELRWRPLATDTSPARAERERRSAALRGEPPRLVVLYVLDALRADFVGHLGGPPSVSPQLDRLAAEGLTFLAHRSPAPNTLPSTRALFTGRVDLGRHGRRSEGPARPYLAELFRQHGYRTGLFSGNGYVSRAYELDRGFEKVAQETYFQGLGPEGYNDNAARVQAAALNWLGSLEAGERAFVYLHTIHPHNPYQPPDDLAARFAPPNGSSVAGDTATLRAVRDGKRRLSAADRERLRGLYAGAFAYNDGLLAAFRAALEERYSEGEVLLIVTSDHGEELFEHGGALHGYTLYEEVLHIPLVLWWPRHIPPGRWTEATGTLDLRSTLVDLLGEEEPDAPAAGPLDLGEGRSFLAWLGEEGDRSASGWCEQGCAHLAAAPTVRDGLYSAVGGGFKLVRAAGKGVGWGMGRGPGRSRDAEYLFDLRSGPKELKNQVGRGGAQELWLRSLLDAWLARDLASTEGEAGATAESREEPELDAETRRQLEALGYLD